MCNYIEFNAVLNHASDISRLGTSALIVTGRASARKCGALSDVQTVLDSAHITYEIFDRIEENPSIETIMSARDAGLASGADFVIGIGGGSPMDAAKAVAIMIKNGSAGWELLYESSQAGGVPVVCVPTTCGTGSEVTAVSVLTRHDLGTKLTAKQKLFPSLSLVDPKYLENASSSIIRNTSIDAMGHMIESIINTNATDESRSHALDGLALWGTVKQYLGNDLPADPDERASVLMKLAQASNEGGYSIVTPGTSLPHGMSYTLTYTKHVPHGMAIGIFEPGFMELADEATRDLLLKTMGFDALDSFREFICRNCSEPMFSNYLSSEEFLDIALHTASDFLQNRTRTEKIPCPIDENIMHKIISDIAAQDPNN